MNGRAEVRGQQRHAAQEFDIGGVGAECVEPDHGAPLPCVEQRVHAGFAQALGVQQIARGFGLRKMSDADARAGFVARIATDDEVEPAPGGFDGLEARMVQQAAHAFPERGFALGIGGLRRRGVGASQIAEVTLKRIAALGDLFQQAGGSQQFAEVRLRSFLVFLTALGGGRRSNSRNKFRLRYRRSG